MKGREERGDGNIGKPKEEGNALEEGKQHARECKQSGVNYGLCNQV